MARFGCLPHAGGLLEQDAQLLRLVAVYDLAHAGPQQLAGPGRQVLDAVPQAVPDEELMGVWIGE